MLTANEVDGSTLLKLTESMIAVLLPTMKLQVSFMEARKQLYSDIGSSKSTEDDNGDRQSSETSAASASVEQNG